MIAFEMKVGPSTVKRVWSYWLTYYEYLPIKEAGRPKGEGLSMSGREIIKQAKKRYKLGSQMLEKIIEKNFGIHIPHNGSPFGVHRRGENGGMG